MQCAHHIDLTKLVAEAINWQGDINTVAKNASFPDEVESIRVDGQGHHIFGLNFASLTHFCKPNRVGKELANYQGYIWSVDPSIPLHANLPNTEVWSDADGWDVPGPMTKLEPLSVLLDQLRKINPKTKKPTGCTAADEISYPTAGWMADWCAGFYGKWPKHNDRLAGWICHFVQDCCIRHHAQGNMLYGHAEYEALLWSWWQGQRQSGKLSVERVKALAGNAEPRSPRAFS